VFRVNPRAFRKRLLREEGYPVEPDYFFGFFLSVFLVPVFLFAIGVFAPPPAEMAGNRDIPVPNSGAVYTESPKSQGKNEDLALSYLTDLESVTSFSIAPEMSEIGCPFADRILYEIARFCGL
jgi:hypothetical protein